MAAKTRLGLHGTASAYAGFQAKSEAINSTSTLVVLGDNDLIVSVAGLSQITVTVTGESNRGA